MSELICPLCEKHLGPEHDDKACERKMSRRFFFGIAFGGIAAAVAKQAPAGETMWWLRGGHFIAGDVLRPMAMMTLTFCPTPNFFNLPEKMYRDVHEKRDKWIGEGSLLKP